MSAPSDDLALLARGSDGRVLWRRVGSFPFQADLEPGGRLTTLVETETVPGGGELMLREGAWVRWRVVALDWPGQGEAQLWTFEDVSEKVRDRLALVEARGKLRLLSSHTQGILFEFDAQARFVRVWASDPNLLMRSEQELIGQNLLEALGPEMGQWHHERVSHTLRTGEGQDYEYTLEVPSGARNFACTSVAVPGPDGSSRGAAFWIRDITDQVELRARLQRTDRLVAVGTLAAGVAHEVNNPLGYMRLNLEHVQRVLLGLGTDPALSARLGPLVKPLDMIREGAERVHAIVAALLDLARASDEPRPVDVRRIVELSLEATASELGSSVEIRREYAAVPPVNADECRLIQVFTNLLANAAQAMARGLRDENWVQVSTRLDANARVVVEIRDTGVGIRREDLKRVFDPFFTTKQNGLGLGLAICHRIVASFGGEIRVESRLNEGTAFSVSLPAATP